MVSYFTDDKIKTECSILNVKKTENKNEIDILNRQQFIVTPFSLIFCYAIPDHTNEYIPTHPSPDTQESVFASVNLYDDGARQSFSEQCRIQSFVCNVPNDFSCVNFRISTFQHVDTSVSALLLAYNGWYYSSSRRETRCFVCNVRRDHWRHGDDPSQFHSNSCR